MKKKNKPKQSSVRDQFAYAVARHANKLVSSGMNAEAAIVVAEAVVSRAWILNAADRPN